MRRRDPGGKKGRHKGCADGILAAEEAGIKGCSDGNLAEERTDIRNRKFAVGRSREFDSD